jgi:glutathione S-transferase
VRLFDFERSPNPRRVRMLLAEKGLNIPRVPVNLFRMEQLSPAFLAINPGGTVPVLETDDGSYIADSLAIALYLERLHPEPALFGGSPRTEALTVMWTRVVESDGLDAVAEVLRNLSPGFRNHVLPGPVPYAQLPALVDRGYRRVAQFFDRIEQQLAKHNHLAGGELSFADLSLLAAVDYAGWVEVRATDGRPAIERWYRRVAARPSAGA